MPTAFEPVTVGRYTTRNRLVMAPMTRSRAYGPGGSPTELMATYYGQRAGAGLIVTEGTQPSPVGQGYPNMPGLHTAEQVPDLPRRLRTGGPFNTPDCTNAYGGEHEGYTDYPTLNV